MRPRYGKLAGFSRNVRYGSLRDVAARLTSALLQPAERTSIYRLSHQNDCLAFSTKLASCLFDPY
jgi:hypothetical protein